MTDPNEEFWEVNRRVAEQSTPPNTEGMTADECHYWNSIRIRLLLDEVLKAKMAGKNILAADLSCLLHDLVCEFRTLLICSVPDYNLMRVTAERMAQTFGGDKPKFPEDN